MRGDKIPTDRGKHVKIPLLPNNVGKKSVYDAGTQQGHNKYQQTRPILNRFQYWGKMNALLEKVLKDMRF